MFIDVFYVYVNAQAVLRWVAIAVVPREAIGIPRGAWVGAGLLEATARRQQQQTKLTWYV